MQGVRVIKGGAELHRPPGTGDNERAAAVELRVNRVDQRLGGLLDVLDEFFQHGLCSSYANLMILSLGGPSCSAPSSAI